MTDPVHVYAILTEARQKLFGWIRPLDQGRYTQEFSFGCRTLRATMIEIAATELYLAMRLREERLPPVAEWPISEERQPTFVSLESAWGALSERTRMTLAHTSDWDHRVTTELVLPQKTLRLTASKADIATQLLLHEVHHRAQAMAMLRQLGVAAQDLDYIGFVQSTETR